MTGTTLQIWEIYASKKNQMKCDELKTETEQSSAASLCSANRDSY